MLNLDELKTIRYVIDQQGHKSAVQVDIHTWAELLHYLEDLEDRAVLRNMLTRLEKGPEKSGAIPWDEARQEW